jgi:long-chain acyl-CoA synthetase
MMAELRFRRLGIGPFWPRGIENETDSQAGCGGWAKGESQEWKLLRSVMRANLLTFLDDCLKREDETAVVYRHRLRTYKWSYGRIRSSAIQIAREFEKRGVERGDRVLFWAENSAEWIAAFFGCLLCGAVAVPLDADSGEDFASRVQKQVAAKLLLRAPDRSAGLAIEMPSLSLKELLSRSAEHSIDPYEGGQVGTADLAEIIFTSGTTAEPKGVCITHRNILANIEPIEREMKKYLPYERIVHPVRFLNLLPLSHVFGQFMGIFVPQLMGGEIHFLDSLNPSDIIETVRNQRVSVIVTVPRILESLRYRVERDWARNGGKKPLTDLLASVEDSGALHRWWTFRRVHREFGLKFWALISGGAALPAATESFWRRLGFAVIQGYGMTETASLVAVNHPFKMGSGSIGKTLPGQEVKLSDKGEILVRGENVSPGYWKGGVQPMQSEKGWLNTGDVAEIDQEGNLYFKSRSKDVIVTSAGLNIYPDDLEAAVKAQKEVKDCAVVSIEGAQGPEPLAVLLLADPSADASKVISNANGRLNQYQQVRRWVVWPEADFPRTSTEKVRKPVVVERLKTSGLLREWASPEPTAALSGIGRPSSFLLEQITRITGHAPATIEPSARLSADLKLDSLGRVELLSAIEDQFHLDLDDAAISDATTLGDIDMLIRGGPSEIQRIRQQSDKPETSSRPLESTGGVSGVETTAGRNGAGHRIDAEANPQPTEVVVDSPPAPRHAQCEGPAEPMKLPAPRIGPYPTWQHRTPVRLIRLAVLYAVILPLTRLMSRATIVGRERLRNIRGPVLVISNHVAMVDQALILLTLPAPLRNRLAIAMEGERLWSWRYPGGGSSLFSRVLGMVEYILVISLFNVFPLPQKSGFRRSFSYAGRCIDAGQSVLVFPEGRRTQTAEMNRFMDGIGLLSAGLDVPVVPMRIDGLHEMKATHRRFAKRGQIRVVIGEPVRFEASDEPSEIARRLEQLVRLL